MEETLFAKYNIELNDGGFFKYYPSPYRNKAEENGVDIKWWGILMRENNFSRLITSDLNFAAFSGK